MAYNKQKLLSIDQIKSKLHSLCTDKQSGDLCLFTEEKHIAVISISDGKIVGLRYWVTRGIDALKQIASITKATINLKKMFSVHLKQ